MVKWGIIGLGNIARRFAKSLEFEKDGKLVAVASKTAGKSDYYKEKYKDIKAYESYEEMLKDSNIDAVYIALPHKLHMKYSIRALNAGKAVLCEKPSCLTSEELSRVIKCAKRNKKFYMEAIKTPFIPMIEVIKEVLHNKVIGDIKSIYASFCSDPIENKNSYLFDEAQGGAILDVASYPISFVFEIVQDRKVISITTEKRDETFEKVKVNTHFDSKIQFENGILGHIEGGIDGKKERTAIIEGTLGTMYVPIFNRPDSYKVILNNGQEYEENRTMLNDDMYGEIHEVHKCLTDKRIESDVQSWDLSMDIIKVIDQIREL